MTPATIVFLAAGWFAGWALALRTRRLGPFDGTRVSVSVVVPARDEMLRLPRLFAALATDRPRQIVVVDDGSTDGTAEKAAAAGATVIASEPPAGWTGKAWACQQGAEAATGEVLVFLDADTEPASGFVDRLAAEALRTGGLVSVQPWHRVEKAYEHLSAVCNVVAVLGAGTGEPGRGWWQGPVAYGPAVAIRREVYLAAGGHAGAASDVVDDLALAASMHAAGVPVLALADDGSGIRYRMYPESVGSLGEGWSKNLAAGAGRVAPLRTLLVVLWVVAGLVAMTYPAGYVVWALQLRMLFWRAGSFSWLAALLWPIPFLAFVGLFAWSLVSRLLRRPVMWRGRLVGG